MHRDIRPQTLLGETQDAVTGQIRETVDRLAASDPALKASVYIVGGEKNAAIRGRFWPENTSPRPGCFRPKTNSSCAPGPACSASACPSGCAFAPASERTGVTTPERSDFRPFSSAQRQDRVHGVDEFIEIDELISACRGYYGIAASALDN
jgi:hypothetical protein